MKWSLNLGKIAGIRLLVHWTFIFLIGWIVFTEMGKGSDLYTILLTIIFVLTIFGCVVLHELGHALTAKRYGIATKKITLLPIGGVASLEKMPEEPKQELMVAIAGPLVNVVIAFILSFFISFNRLTSEEAMVDTVTLNNFLYLLFAVNIFLVVFNAIPAFPMDGGRVLRALLALKLDRVKATQIAANLGKFVAVGFVFLGLFYNPFLVLIGIFVYFGAHSENMTVQYLEFLKGHRVKEAMITNFARLKPEATLQDAVDQLLATSDHDLVVADDDKVHGIINRSRLFEFLKKNEMDTKVTQVMNKDVEMIDINDKLTNVYLKMQKTRNSIFPVTENDRLKGIINLDNINEFVMIRSALNY